MVTSAVGRWCLSNVSHLIYRIQQSIEKFLRFHLFVSFTVGKTKNALLFEKLPFFMMTRLPFIHQKRLENKRLACAIPEVEYS
ncbi:hypothetical protein AQUCO_01600014v1 [Aquilegia coerulea]|uniref:Uncharacterized protein n=1 Tax=Aquilegia coerulea TaxID=218851 RepID=A0A2G5DPT1_AQUCA|nr:hypothetical protein AQUCO_01600014v1 [Aquilegia coerulea]